MIPTPNANDDRAHAGPGVGDERGVALILALLVTLALSALTASLMLTSRTETFSGMNYRLLAQTRYGAEAGMHQTVNYCSTATRRQAAQWTRLPTTTRRSRR